MISVLGRPVLMPFVINWDPSVPVKSWRKAWPPWSTTLLKVRQMMVMMIPMMLIPALTLTSLY